MSAALATRRLSKRYGAIWALREVDLTITAQSITALVGPNAAGKSTLLRSWMGFEKPTSGDALVCGRDVGADRRQALRRAGYVSQNPGLYENLTVSDHLVMAEHLRVGFDRVAALRRLDDLGIPLQARGGGLSGGQQSQVVLAIALAIHPDVLLLDEPLSQLDPLARREFLGVVAEVSSAEGTTVVLSSHIVTDIEQVCSHIAVLADGRIRLHASIAEARARYSVALVTDDVRDRVVGSDATSPALLEHPPGQGPPTQRPASLDEIVLAHLAAARIPANGPPT